MACWRYPGFVMWKAAEGLHVSADDRALLEEFLRSGNTPQKVAFRIRIVLEASQGKSNYELAQSLATTRVTVLKWRQRYLEAGVEGLLEDAPGRGRKKSISADQEATIVKATIETKPKHATHWSTRSLASEQGVSDSTVLRIWHAHHLQPHRLEKFKASTDPRFVEKVRDVVGLYLNPPDKALVLSVDEKSQIQALDRTQPILPLRPGIPERQTHDYQRHGTSTLFAALNVLDGTVVGPCSARHRHQEFLRFLNKLDRTVPADRDVHLILDNYGTHTHAKVKNWLAVRPHYHLHFTPTSSSWLNLVERFFAEITERRIRRGTFRSVPELVSAITSYIRERNKHPKPFNWTAQPKEIIRKVQKARRCLGNSEAGQ
jgi:transposase